jgi:hypothetical protein
LLCAPTVNVVPELEAGLTAIHDMFAVAVQLARQSAGVPVIVTLL